MVAAPDDIVVALLPPLEPPVVSPVPDALPPELSSEALVNGVLAVPQPNAKTQPTIEDVPKLYFM